MRIRKLIVPCALATLSLGFLGQTPQSFVNQRHISSSCTDPNVASAPKALVPGIPKDFFNFIQDDSARRTAEAYSIFLQSMQINASLASLTVPSQLGYPQPAFPSYAMPSIYDHPIEMGRPDSSHQIFGGLSTNPQVQFLIRPSTTPSQSRPIASVAAAANIPKIESTATVSLLPAQGNVQVSRF